MKALIIVDMQNDFMPQGALGVPHADALIPVINALIPKFPLVIASQDWHPLDHISFASNHPGKKVGDLVDVEGSPQILWPVHCVCHTKGAEFVSTLHTQKIQAHFYKGTDPKIDSYSTFFDNAHHKSTGLADYLKERGVQELYFVGVATEFCVLYSTLDALQLGFTVTVILDGCRAIDAQAERAAIDVMRAKGVKISSSKEWTYYPTSQIDDK
jgi:nicotinamidase/pyrazinamidase